MNASDKVRVTTKQANKGEILDRNNQILAGKGVASSVGIVSGKLEDRKGAIQEMEELLKIGPKTIEKKLSEIWVKDDSFVPIKTIPKVDEIELLSMKPYEGKLKELERQKKLLEISRVMNF